MIKVIPQVELGTARLLAGFAEEVAGRKLDKHGFTAEVRRSMEDGFEVHITFDYHGVLFVDSKRLRKARGDEMRRIGDELSALMDSMREMIRALVTEGKP